MVNISKYKSQREEEQIYYGQFSLKKDYLFADGDEAFYRLIGENSCYSMLELLHPDDVEEFLQTEEALAQGRQYMILRMRCYHNKYRYLYMEMYRNGKEFNGFASVTVEFCDFMELKDRYLVYLLLVKKYREFMGLSDQMYFEYSFDSDILNVYQYVNVKSIPVLKMPLKELREQVVLSSQMTPEEKTEFEVLYELLYKGAERFDVTVAAHILSPDQPNARYQFKGSTMYRNGMCDMVVGIINYLGKKEEKKRYYLTDSAYDSGTGLLNKRAVTEYAIEKIQEYTQKNKNLYLAVMDVDDFKHINDTYGHMFGDEVLTRVSEILRSVLDARGVAGRFGGDEFMLVIEGVEEEKDLRRILKTMNKHIHWGYIDHKDSLMVTTSCGISRFPDDGANFEELFQKADKALYIAKAKGKNRFIIYDEKKHGSVENEEEQVNVGLKLMASDEKKSEMIAELVVTLHEKGQAGLSYAMKQLREYFDIDGIAIYTGTDWKRTYSAGKYVNPIAQLTFMENSNYRNLFDEQGVYVESKIGRLDNTYLEAYRLYEKQENGKVIQFATWGDKQALVSLDFFNRSPKIGVADMGLLKIAGRLMAQIAAR